MAFTVCPGLILQFVATASFPVIGHDSSVIGITFADKLLQQ